MYPWERTGEGLRIKRNKPKKKTTTRFYCAPGRREVERVEGRRKRRENRTGRDDNPAARVGGGISSRPATRHFLHLIDGASDMHAHVISKVGSVLCTLIVLALLLLGCLRLISGGETKLMSVSPPDDPGVVISFSFAPTGIQRFFLVTTMRGSSAMKYIVWEAIKPLYVQVEECLRQSRIHFSSSILYLVNRLGS
jgi:hypothetical protein